MKTEKIEELLISATQKCGHCLHWRFTHYDQGECERYQIPNTHKDDGGICNGFKIDVYRVQLGIVEFTQAINQAELEWYKKLEKKLQLIMESTPFNPIVNMNTLTDYFNEIQNKIKGLEKTGGIREMKIEIEINEDLLEWIVNSLYSNLDTDNLEQIEIIEYLESKQYEQ